MHIKKPYLLLLIICALALIGELYLRYSVYRSPSIDIESPDEKLVYELNPKHSQINSFGMRQKDFSKKDIQNHLVIACIGDSHTFCAQIKYSRDAYPQKIEYYLNELYGVDKARVLNFGIPGYNTAQELELLKSKVLGFKPDLVILQITINDTHICNYIQPENRFLNHMIHKSELFAFILKKILYNKYLKLWRVVEKKWPDLLIYQDGLIGAAQDSTERDPLHMGHPPRDPRLVPVRYHYMLGEENWKMHIKEFAQICRDHGIRVIATGFIEKWQQEYLLRSGFKVYSFDEMFGGISKITYAYDPRHTYTHFNEEGYDIIGHKLADYIYKSENYVKK